VSSDISVTSAFPAREFDVVVIGDCNPDIVLSGPDVEPEFGQHEKLVPQAAVAVGGSGSITACACARAGLRTAFIGATGDDLYGRFMLGELARFGVDTTMCPVVQGVGTGFSVVLSRGADRAILTHLGTIDHLEAADLRPAALSRARHVHISSYFLQPRLAGLLPGLVGPLGRQGVSFSVDPNWDPDGRWDGGLKALLPSLALFFPNAAEAEAMTGEPGPGEAALALAASGTVVVVKDGDRGCVAAQGTDLYRQGPFPMASADTTGAGDAFNAGFLSAWLAGQPLPGCLRYACAYGALSTRAIGATGALGTPAEAEELLAKPFL
jgi:sugar/nucleoside kinase (ribokinase family)